MSMLTKFKYVGVSTEDLLDIYILHIRSVAEYFSVTFHSRLTVEQTHNINLSLKIILSEMHIDLTHCWKCVADIG